MAWYISALQGWTFVHRGARHLELTEEESDEGSASDSDQCEWPPAADVLIERQTVHKGRHWTVRPISRTRLHQPVDGTNNHRADCCADCCAGTELGHKA